MSEDVFGGPASAAGVKVTEFEGRLLLITPKSHEESIQTDFGEKDAVKCTLAVLDEKDASKSESYDDVLLFQARLIGQTKPAIGKRLVLGRLGKGEAKKGQSAPWQLEDPSEDDKVVARKYLSFNQPDFG
jgi:hypothetical protein